jgi:hypothetical protein
MKKTLTILLFISFVSYAGIVDFSGSASIYAEYNDVNGDTLIDPTSQVRFNISPTISFYTMPITFDLSLNTMESKLRQALNKFHVSIQPEKMLREKVPHVPSIVFAISDVEFGTCYPYFSPYTLSGVPVSGGVVELNPGIFHLEGAMGSLQRSVDWSDTTYTEYAYARSLVAFSVGFGKKDAPHLHFIYMHSGDDTASVDPALLPFYADSDSVEITKPMENYIVGIDLGFSLFDSRLNIESEIIGTEVTRDVRLPALTYEDIPSFLTSLFKPRLSSAFDLALKVNSSLNISSTEISGSFGMVGPNFESFGNPYLRNDVLSYEAGIKQNFLNNSMFLFASLLRERDNLLGTKSSTTAFNSYEFGIGFNFASLPYLEFGYSPYSERDDSLGLNRNSNMFSVNTGYSFNLGGIGNSLSVFFSHQSYDDKADSSNYSGKAISVGDQVNFTIPLSLSFAVDYSGTSYPDTSDNILSFDVGAYYTSFERWTNGIGFNTSQGEGDVSRNGIYLSSSLSMGIFGNLGLDVERNFYSGESEDEDYDEWRIIGSISSSW